MKHSNFYLQAYTVDWNNEESDSLHLNYAYEGKKEWFALNGYNGILFAKAGSKRMKNPTFAKDDKGYLVIACDATDESKAFVYHTSDFIHYSKEEYVDTASITCERSNEIEITEEILNKLTETYGKPEPVVMESVSEVMLTGEAGSVELPKTLAITYSNGWTNEENVIWEDADLSKPGTYQVEGKVVNHMYTNPLIYHRADPFIYKHTDGYYYFTASHTDNDHNLDGPYQYRHIYLRRAKSLEDLADNSGKYEEVSVFDRDPLPGNLCPHIWAPEIHYVRGAWYIYYTTATEDTDLWSIRPCVMECKAENPMDPAAWVNHGQVKKTTQDSIAFTDFSLDHTVLERGDELYFFWAEKHPVNSDIYCAKMVDPCTIDSSKICKVVEPTYNWETHGFPVCEGPGFLHRNGRYFMTYSASGTDCLYCLGLVTIDEDADFLDPKNWKKSQSPVFISSRTTGQYGPGHNSFTFDEEGHDIFEYHARQSEHYLNDPTYQPLYDAGRNTSVMRLYWNPDGTPNFSVPTPNCEHGFDDEIKVTAHVVVK